VRDTSKALEIQGFYKTTVPLLASDLVVTIFRGASADRKEERCFNLQELEALIIGTDAPTKAALPWLKLARFGDKPSAKGSLRHDRNVLAISGIEADYDGEEITFETAVDTLARAGIAGLIYTSPSFTEDTPRWRVLCPTSKELPPGARGDLVARLNGLFADNLARESFTLSQAYYFGSVKQNPSHRAFITDGKAIDLAAELDAGAIGKPGKPSNHPMPRRAPLEGLQGHGTAWGRAALERECSAIRTAGPGHKWHAINRAGYAIGGLVAAGELQEGPAYAALKDAVHSRQAECDDFGHAVRTLETGFTEGKAAPRQPPPPRLTQGAHGHGGGSDKPPPNDELPGNDTDYAVELTEDGIALEFERRFHNRLRYCHSKKLTGAQTMTPKPFTGRARWCASITDPPTSKRGPSLAKRLLRVASNALPKRRDASPSLRKYGTRILGYSARLEAFWICARASFARQNRKTTSPKSRPSRQPIRRTAPCGGRFSNRQPATTWSLSASCNNGPDTA
jgi:hypothetical protein